MTKKAKECAECAHRRWIGDSGLECTKGHKPRFYAPNGNPHFCDWGWKRRCADFAVGDHVRRITPAGTDRMADHDPLPAPKTQLEIGAAHERTA